MAKLPSRSHVVLPCLDLDLAVHTTNSSPVLVLRSLKMDSRQTASTHLWPWVSPCPLYVAIRQGEQGGRSSGERVDASCGDRQYNYIGEGHGLIYKFETHAPVIAQYVPKGKCTANVRGLGNIGVQNLTPSILPPKPTTLHQNLTPSILPSIWSTPYAPIYPSFGLKPSIHGLLACSCSSTDLSRCN